VVEHSTLTLILTPILTLTLTLTLTPQPHPHQVEHSGSFNGGHYTAYVRDGDLDADDENHSEWNHFSDTHVSRATEEQVLGAQAFLLFYARC